MSTIWNQVGSSEVQNPEKNHKSWRNSEVSEPKTREMNEILPYLYIGSLMDSRSSDQMKKYGIKRIVTCMKEPFLTFNDNVKRLHLPLEDQASENIVRFFEKAIDFIHEARLAKEPVLVHCFVGVSRSPTIVAAYLLTLYPVDFFTTIKFIQSKRPIVNPNFGFRMALNKYALEEKCLSHRQRLRATIPEAQVRQDEEILRADNPCIPQFE